MRTRLFSACVAAALLASTATAQTSPTAPPAAPTSLPAVDPPPRPPVLVIEAAERPPAELAPPEPPGPPATPGPLARIGTLWRAPVPDTPLLMPAPDALAPAAPAGPARFWVDNEMLLWAVQGARLPVLLTTSPAGTPAATAGVLGSGGTPVYGPGSVANSMRMGWRATVGSWLDDDQRYALEAQFLILANGGSLFSTASNGTPILARPVINSATGLAAAEPIAVPGVATGAIRISTTTSGLVGGGFVLRENFHRSDDPCDTCRLCAGGGCGPGGCGGGWGGLGLFTRFDSLIGFRYLRMADHLQIDDTVNAVAAMPGLPAGSTLSRTDHFDAHNNFYGVDLGVTGEVRRGDWSVDMLAKVAVGFNDASVDLAGVRAVNGAIAPGGLLGQPSNFGHYTNTAASAVPELGLKLAYQIRPNMRLSVGYTFLYWYHVARAANQVNPIIDPGFLANGFPTGAAPVSPLPPSAIGVNERSIWVQGVNVGFEWRY